MKESGRVPLIPDGESGDAGRRVRPIFGWLVALTMVSSIVLLFATRSTEPARWSIKAVQAEFRSIAPPAEATATGDLQTFSKYRLISVKSRYGFPGASGSSVGTLPGGAHR